MIQTTSGVTLRRATRLIILGLALAGLAFLGPLAGPERAWAWEIVTVAGTCFEPIDLALDANAAPHVVFGGLNLSTRLMELYYARRTTGVWQVEALARLDLTIAHPAIGVDAAGQVHLAYCVGDDLVYLTNAGGVWSSTVIDRVQFALGYASLAVEPTGAVHLVYVDPYASLKYATNLTGVWVTSFVEGDGSIGTVATDTSLVRDAAGTLNLTYLNLGRLTYAVNTGAGWAKTTVDGSAMATFRTSLALDPLGQAHVSYRGQNGAVRYATNQGGGWAVQEVDNAGVIGGFSSVAVDQSGRPHVIYTVYDPAAGPLASFPLKHAVLSGGLWTKEVVDTRSAFWNALAIDQADRLQAAWSTGYGLIFGSQPAQ